MRGSSRTKNNRSSATRQGKVVFEGGHGGVSNAMRREHRNDAEEIMPKEQSRCTMGTRISRCSEPALAQA